MFKIKFQMYKRKFAVSNGTIYKKDKTGSIWRRIGDCDGTKANAGVKINELIKSGVLALRD